MINQREIQGIRENRFKGKDMNFGAIRVLFVAATIVLGLWFGLGFLMPLMFSDISKSGQFGDGFGSVNALFSGLGFIALTYTIILQVESIKELKKQRESTYRPELYVGEKSIELYYKTSDGTHFTFESSNVKGSVRSPRLDVYNLGSGAAKAVVFSWDFDVKAIIDQISEISEGFCTVESSSHGSVYVKIPSLNLETLSMSGRGGQNFNSNFILPASFGTATTTIGTPYVYDLLFVVFHCCCFEYFVKKGRKGISSYWEKFLCPTLKITYLDIQNNFFEKTFEIKYSVSTMAMPSPDLEHSFCSFQIVCREL